MLDERAGDTALPALRDSAGGRQADICDHHRVIGDSRCQSGVAEDPRAGLGQGCAGDADIVNAVLARNRGGPRGAVAVAA
eukprot:11155249-Lingulodinium_polyedra.AAC.1